MASKNPPAGSLRRVLAFTFLIAGLSAPVASAPAPPGRVAEIVSVQGKGESKSDDREAWRQATVKQPLLAGHFVRTGALSRMGLVFVDDTQIRLNQNSVLQIKQVASAGKSDSTVLGLLAGRGWSQSKVAPKKLIVETPSATAAIRGTDWELSVDDQGAATLTVLSGEVEFYNDLGTVLVSTNQQARAEIGKAPVKLLISNPADRVQWVTAYTVDPLRSVYLDSPADMGRWDDARAQWTTALAADPNDGPALLGLGYAALHDHDVRAASSFFSRAEAASLPRDERHMARLGRASAAIQSEDFQSAFVALQEMAREPDLPRPSCFLLLADLMVYSGDLARALEYVDRGLERFPQDDRLRAMRGRIYLHGDRLTEARAEIDTALAAKPRSLEARLALGDLLRFDGDAVGARAAYMTALAVNPGDARAWYGLGAISNEREDARHGRRELQTAVTLDPAGPGYAGELGTLETFANNFADADRHYAGALAANAGDYVALTGDALLELKRGHARAALELLLRASLLEPRYARAHMYMAVAQYRLGRIDLAHEELRRASALDEKDPFPYMLASMIDTDVFRPDQAIDAGRTALRLMPYLKSLNQLANNQKGTANLGNAFAFVGMEEWAQSLAQQSYYPYWAGSHLFLGDRYPGLFDKNSEYFQGVLADPTVFGASNRYQSLLATPGHYVTTGSRAGGSKDLAVAQPYVTANGTVYAPRPAAYFVDVENSQLIPDAISLDGRVNSITGAVGTSVTPELGIFAWGNYEDIDTTVTETSAGLQPSRITQITRKIDIGASYRLAPTSMVWAKWGAENVGTGFTLRLTDQASHATIDFFERATSQDVQLRHTFVAGRHEITWGLEGGDRDKVQHLFLSGANEGEPPEGGGIQQPATEISRLAYGGDRVTVGSRLLIDAGAFVQRYSKHVTTTLDEAWHEDPSEFSDGSVKTRVSPRAGLVYGLGDQRLVRVAYQRWVRPASENTLGPVATAGVPIDDQIVALGGTLDRVRAQLEWAWSPRMFSTVFVDRKRITNLALSDGIKQAPNLENLQRVRNAVFVNLANQDLLEAAPIFERGETRAAGVSLDRLLPGRLSAYARYIFTCSESTTAGVAASLVPYVPRHLVVLGSTWVGPRRFYIGGQAVYRSTRLQNDAEEPPLAPQWSGTIRGYWELPSKHWSVEAGVEDLGSKVYPASYTIDLKLRY